MEVSKEIVSSNFIWRIMERFGAQIVTFIVSIILARLLEPELYGEVVLVTVFSSILQVFVDSGLGSALIQKKDVDDLDFSTVFYFNLVFCIVLYALMFLGAPAIASFYNKAGLTSVIRVLSLIIVISGVKNIQQTYVTKNMLFKKFFYATLGGTLGSAFVGIYLAYRGFGVWALIAQELSNMAVDTIILWVTVKWRPKLKFSFKRLQTLFSYGWKLLAAQLVDSLYENIRSLIIGKKYSSNSLAYYNKGKQFPTLVITNIGSSIDSVLFPSMAIEQNNRLKIKSMLARSLKLSTYVMTPILIGMAAIAEPLITILLTEKWIYCVPYMRIFCFAMTITPIALSNLNVIKALGKSDIYLQLEIKRKVVGLLTLISMMWFGVKFIALSYLLNMVINFFINTNANGKLLGYGAIKQIKDTFPSFFYSVVMGIAVYLIGYLEISPILTLSLQIPAGILVYITISFITKSESLKYIMVICKDYVESKRK